MGRKKIQVILTVSYQLVSDNLSCLDFYHSFLIIIPQPVYYQLPKESFKIFFQILTHDNLIPRYAYISYILYVPLLYTL